MDPEVVVAPGGVVCDDRPAIRRSVGALLVRCGFELTGEVATFAALHELVLRTRPAVVVLTLPLAGMSTLAAVGALRREAPGSEIVVLSLRDPRDRSPRGGCHSPCVR